MAEWNSRRLSALLATNIDSLVLAAVRDGKSAELEAFSNNLARQAKLAPAQPDHVNLKVVTQDGNEIYFKCKQATPLQKLMHAFCNRQGVSTNSVVFSFDGNRINETQTPEQLSMEDGDIIDVRLEQQGGCIASPVPALFGAHAHAVGLRYLECAGELSHSTPQDARAIVLRLGGSLNAGPEIGVEPVLDASACAALTAYLDEHAARETGAAPDLRLTLREAELEALIGVRACAAVVAAFGTPFDAIRLRRAEASTPLPQCVAFHTDFSKRTMQVKLDDIHLHLRGGYVHEYLYPWVNRSRSTATTSTKVAGWSSPPVPASCSRHAPAARPPVRPRPLEHSAGIVRNNAALTPLFDTHAAVHVNACVHGVSALRSGVRYGLFLCDTVGDRVAASDALRYLEEAVGAQPAFFERALGFLEEATDAQLETCVRAYTSFLGSLAVCAAKAPAERPASVAPSFGVELAWRTHLLHPVAYARACAVLSGCEGAEAEALGSEALIDHAPRPAAEYADGAPYNEYASAEGADVPQLGLDLVRAIRRQQEFMQAMLADGLPDPIRISSALDDYLDFLGRVKHSKQPLVPTRAVDLMWHTHMFFPRRYAAECLSLAGSFVDHDDDVDGDVDTGDRMTGGDQL